MTSKTVQIKYFASLKETTNLDSESYNTKAASAIELYNELNSKYHFPIHKDDLKISINCSYVEFNSKIHNDDTIVFIPPVSGG